jgi:hypothetical protein
MIPNQAHLFDIPQEVTYLNCAYTSPLLKTARAAGEGAVQAKSQPWNITPAHFFSSIDPLRDLFSKLVGGSPDNVAIIPLEENWLNRAGSEDFSRLVEYQDEYQPGARKFDVGGASNFFLSPVVQAALTQILEWQVPEIEMSLKTITTQIADKAREFGFKVPDEPFRSPHLIGITTPHGISKDLPAKLAQEKIFVSIRGQSIRVAPHLYTTAHHVEKLFNALC